MRLLLLISVFMLSVCSCNNEHLGANSKIQILEVIQKQQVDWDSGSLKAYMEAYWK